jgi:hypothetical protein
MIVHNFTRRVLSVAVTSVIVASSMAPSVGWAEKILPGADNGEPTTPDQVRPAPTANPRPPGPPPDCGPQHHVGEYSAAACMPVDSDGVVHPDAYVTTPPNTSSSHCEIVFAIYHHDGSLAGSAFPSGTFDRDTQSCRAGTNLHYVPTGLPDLIAVGPPPLSEGNDLQLVVNVIDHGVTKVIADSPVQTDKGRNGGVSPTTVNDAVSTKGPGDGQASTTELFCHVPLPFATDAGVLPGAGIPGTAPTLDVSATAHLNVDGTVSSVDDFDAEIGGFNALVTKRDANSSTLIGNSGRSVELHTHADIQYGASPGGIPVNAPLPVDCYAYYTF